MFSTYFYSLFRVHKTKPIWRLAPSSQNLHEIYLMWFCTCKNRLTTPLDNKSIFISWYRQYWNICTMALEYFPVCHAVLTQKCVDKFYYLPFYFTFLKEHTRRRRTKKQKISFPSKFGRLDVHFFYLGGSVFSAAPFVVRINIKRWHWHHGIRRMFLLFHTKSQYAFVRMFSYALFRIRVYLHNKWR